MIRTGELTERVTIQAQQQVTLPGGTLQQSWVDVATVFAKVTPKSGRERSMGQQTEANASYRVTIRRRTDVTEKHRLVWLSRPMNIRFVGLNSPRDLFMTLDAEFGVAD